MKKIIVLLITCLSLNQGIAQIHFGAEVDFGLIGRTINNKATLQAGYFPFEVNIFAGHDNLANGNLLIGVEVHTHLGKQKFRKLSNDDELIKFQQNKFGVFAKYDFVGLFNGGSYVNFDNKFALAGVTSLGLNSSNILIDGIEEKLSDRSFYWSIGLSAEYNVIENLRIVLLKPRFFFNKVKDNQSVFEKGFNGSVWEINVGAVYTF